MKALLLALCALAVASPDAARAVERPDIKFTLDWAFQGPESVFTFAADRGFFKNEGLNAVQVDRSGGSTDAVVRVASGAYEFGWAEMSSLIKYNTQNPDNPLVAIYVTHENSANSVMAIKGHGVAGPKDLEGKKVAATPGSAASDIFAAFAKANHVDASKIGLQTVASNLRDALLVKGEVQAVLGGITSGVPTMWSLGVKPEDIVLMPYGDFGVELYGHTVITSAAFAEKNPETTGAVVRGVNKALKAAIADPKAAVASLTAHDQLVDLALEKERLLLMLQRLVLTKNIQATGLSTVDPERLRKTIEVICDAYDVKTRPDPAKLFTDRFLPPRSERMPPELGR
jgi:NitT/TauT family transport system substrate-binding protein